MKSRETQTKRTVLCPMKVTTGDSIQWDSATGSHLIFENTVSPFPIHQHNPYFSIFLPANTLHQVYDGAWPNLAWRKEHWGLYLAFQILAKIESGSFKNFHPCLANIARLKDCYSLKPNPPLRLETHKLSHLVQCIFSSECFCPHH